MLHCVLKWLSFGGQFVDMQGVVWVVNGSVLYTEIKWELFWLKDFCKENVQLKNQDFVLKHFTLIVHDQNFMKSNCCGFTRLRKSFSSENFPAFSALIFLYSKDCSSEKKNDVTLWIRIVSYRKSGNFRVQKFSCKKFSSKKIFGCERLPEN